MIGNLNGDHEWREEVMQEAFFTDEADQERDDDKCLMWITLKKGTDKE